MGGATFLVSDSSYLSKRSLSKRQVSVPAYMALFNLATPTQQQKKIPVAYACLKYTGPAAKLYYQKLAQGINWSKVVGKEKDDPKNKQTKTLPGNEIPIAYDKAQATQFRNKEFNETTFVPGAVSMTFKKNFLNADVELGNCFAAKSGNLDTIWVPSPVPNMVATYQLSSFLDSTACIATDNMKSIYYMTRCVTFGGKKRDATGPWEKRVPKEPKGTDFLIGTTSTFFKTRDLNRVFGIPAGSKFTEPEIAFQAQNTADTLCVGTFTNTTTKEWSIELKKQVCFGDMAPVIPNGNIIKQKLKKDKTPVAGQFVADRTANAAQRWAGYTYNSMVGYPTY